MVETEAMNEADILRGEKLSVVTGAFGYTGRHIARKLLERGVRVRTLTNRRGQWDSIAGPLEISPLDFDNPAALRAALRGADTLYNTYWIRFEHGAAKFDKTVERLRMLFRTARQVGVRRIVHLSITNPSLDSPLPYFRGKAQVEQALRESGVSYAILRPTVIFGDGGILINNIAWLLRRFPFFAVPGDGQYRLQPVFVEDLADLAVESAAHDRNEILDAVGPEIFTFDELVRAVANGIHARARILHAPPAAVLALSKLLRLPLGDLLLTREEIDGLMQGLLVSSASPTCHAKLTDWLALHADSAGRHYLSELDLHYRRR